MNKEQKKIINQHNKWKINRELKELKKLEQEIMKNMEELNKEIEEELRELNNKANEWSYIELNKYKRLEKAHRNIKEKIKDRKSKELEIILAFLVTNGLRTRDEIGELVGANKEKVRKIGKRRINEVIKHPWSGLSIYERHEKSTRNLQLKIKEVINSSIVTDRGNVRTAVKSVKNEITKAGNPAFRLADTENTHLNYEVTKEVIEMVEVERIRYMYNAVLDSRTCSDCSRNDGKIYEIGKEPQLPTHINCRCFYTPIADTVWIMQTNALPTNKPM
ncbi:minor capsid protein [Tepidimicrobium xylanilyticum]